MGGPLLPFGLGELGGRGEPFADVARYGPRKRFGVTMARRRRSFRESGFVHQSANEGPRFGLSAVRSEVGMAIHES